MRCGDRKLCRLLVVGYLHFIEYDGLTEPGRRDDSNSRAKFHRKTTGRGVKRDPITEISHDIVAVGPDTNGDSSTSKGPIGISI